MHLGYTFQECLEIELKLSPNKKKLCHEGGVVGIVRKCIIHSLFVGIVTVNVLCYHFEQELETKGPEACQLHF